MSKGISSEKMMDLLIEKSGKFYKEMYDLCESYKNGTVSQRNQRKSGSRSRRKVIRDPNAPKKPNTAYILYFQERKPYYVSTNPKIAITEVTKMIGKEWKELPAEKQKIFLDRANAAKERYNKENNIYLAKKKKDEEQKTKDEEISKRKIQISDDDGEVEEEEENHEEDNNEEEVEEDESHAKAHSDEEEEEEEEVHQTKNIKKISAPSKSSKIPVHQDKFLGSDSEDDAREKKIIKKVKK